jgi:hypothetical protein
MCKKLFLVVSFILLLALATPVSADELLASYEDSEMTDLTISDTVDRGLTVTRVKGGVDGAPPTTDGEYILKWVWKDETDRKIEIRHTWANRRLDLAPYRTISCDVWFDGPSAQPATIGIWDDVFGWAGAISVPTGIGRWHTVKMDISGMNQSDIDHIFAFLFEDLAGATGVLYTDNMWLLWDEQVTAWRPIPFNKAVSMELDVDLSWNSGIRADSHDVYFGTDFNDVNDATTNTEGTYRGNQALGNTSYDPGTLEYGKTYYWRIDEVDDSGSTIWKGDVWSFKTAPSEYIEIPLVSYEDSESYYEVWSSPAQAGPDSSLILGDKLLGGSTWEDVVVPAATDGNNVLGLKWTEEDDLEVEHGCTFENSNFRYDLLDIDEMAFDIYYTDGSPLPHSMGVFDWRFVPSFNPSSNLPTTTGQWYTIVIDVSHLNNTGLDSILDFMFQGHGEDFDPDYDDPNNWAAVVFMDNLRLRCAASRYATFPSPSDGATDVYRNTDMSWRAGVRAASHDVYLGTDYDDVNDANTLDPEFKGNQPLNANSYDPPGDLEPNITYYWRIDEVNDAHEDKLWKGTVWSFTVANFTVVDDFEDYNDSEPDRIFDTWVDGWNIAENGSQAGYGQAPFAEQRIVHSGSQSMPFSYDNTTTAVYSEAARTFDIPQDWTRDGAQTLTLFFKGYPLAFVEDPAGTYTMSAAGSDVWYISDEFRYAYKVLLGDGSITARVVSIENTNDWAKAGVMIRETLEPFSVNGFMCATPDGRRVFQNRPIAASDSFSANSDAGAIILPLWVRLVRQGNTITAYYSQNGTNWIQQPDDENTGEDASVNPQTIVMRQDVFIGLAHTSHNSSEIGTSVFSDVTITGNVIGDDWEVEAIGVEMSANDPQPLYVAVEGAGVEKVVEHPDNSDAVLSNDWLRWDISLSIFEDADVDLEAVEKLTIGVGSRTAPQQNGAGTLYFDDVRLYRASP